MFERFTNKARHVVVLAQEEARLLSHNYIGTEHILLGLLGEPESVGGTVLTSFGMTRDGVRVEVEEAVGRGKKAPTGHIPFTPRAKKTLELSLREALAIKHNYIGTEHILLGLIREGEGVAAQIMRNHADLADIRAAVLTAVAATSEAGEETDETNAVLRWLRQRLSGRQSSAAAVPFSPEAQAAALAAHGTPAVEAALRQATALAGQAPVGSHHLLLAALADTNSAASWALASLGVNIDELRAKLRSAQVTGTSDEQPEQAGRRQMTIQVADEMLTLTLTDPIIVEAAKEALRVVNARAAAAAKAAAAATAEAAGEESTGGEAAESSAEAAGEAAVEDTVIRGDLPDAAGLADVWLELRKSLNTLADPVAHARRVAVAVRPPSGTGPAEPAESTDEGEPDEPEAPEAASS